MVIVLPPLRLGLSQPAPAEQVAVDWQLKEGIVFQKIARELESFALDKMDFKEIQLGGLELYNQDFDDENKPPDGGLFYVSACRLDCLRYADGVIPFHFLNAS